ncbi:efflux RND transporter periplasmic adaptor subunit [Cerasicoccus maritimus]|uniref:efflux RND transporter periplasmic adaptor subunit n=1 Tax=Cerasicoccus maritimus TaxID=490089 RepID=UPI002852940F|nr:efflux RND transporter periplasmic adaptor subunit [Cerasicoccus maritimus]
MRLYAFFSLALGALLLVGCPKRNEFAEPPPPSVSVSIVEPQTVTVYDSMPGQTAAANTVDIVARVQGFLETQAFDDGAYVKKDQLLFTIDPAEYQANLNAAKGKMSSAQASVDLAETTYKRNKELFATQAISELEMLQSEADLDLVKGQFEQAKAELARAKLDLSYTEIVTPIDGKVSREFVSPGNLVGPGVSNALARVVSVDPMYFYFNVDERTLLDYQKIDRRMKQQDSTARMRVSLELADGSIYSQQGEVDYVDNQVDTMTGTIEIRAVFPNPDLQLYPGLFGNIRFADKREDSIVVPETVIQKDLAGDFVLVVNDQSIVEIRYVKKGARVEQGIILLEGLEAGEKLIINGIQRARPGAPVKIDDQATPKPE